MATPIGNNPEVQNTNLYQVDSKGNITNKLQNITERRLTLYSIY